MHGSPDSMSPTLVGDVNLLYTSLNSPIPYSSISDLYFESFDRRFRAYTESTNLLPILRLLFYSPLSCSSPSLTSSPNQSNLNDPRPDSISDPLPNSNQGPMLPTSATWTRRSCGFADSLGYLQLPTPSRLLHPPRRPWTSPSELRLQPLLGRRRAPSVLSTLGYPHTR